MRGVAVLLVGLMVLVGCAGEDVEEVADSVHAPTGPYLGQEPPGTTPELFYATGLGERDMAIVPTGDELFFSMWERSQGYLLTRVDGPDGWSAPEIAPFSSTAHSELEPFVTADGGWLYYISKRPLPDGSEPEKFDLWRVPKIAGGWGEPERLPEPVNTEHDEFYPSLTDDGDLYFTSDRPGGLGGEDIWFAEWTGDGWAEPVNLGEAVNSPGPEFNSLVAPDGSWLIFGGAREGDLGRGDLHIAFRGADGAFMPARNMGAPINSSAFDYCPSLSPDRSILFFTSNRVIEGEPEPATFAELEAALSGPSNGRDNVWWVSAEVIDRLRQARPPEAQSAH